MRVQSRIGVVAAFAFAVVLVASTAGAQQFELISSFTGCAPEGCGTTGDPAHPGSLVRGPDGNFYGTSGFDRRPGDPGPRSWGTVFRIAPDGARQILHVFDGTTAGGCGTAGVTFGQDGALYGVTGGGCATPATGRVIFRISDGSYSVVQELPAGSLIPYTFVAGSNGAFYGLAHVDPDRTAVVKWDGNSVTQVTAFGSQAILTNLVPAPDGNIYFSWEVNNSIIELNLGKIYRLTPSDALQTVWESFDRIVPRGDLVVGPDGTLYGSTVQFITGVGPLRPYRLTPGGALTYYPGATPGIVRAADVDHSVYLETGGAFGSIARLFPDGTLVPVHQFEETDGAGPMSQLVRGADGHLYGTRGDGGADGLGTFYRLRMPTVDLKANGLDGPVVVSTGNPLQVSMSFDAASDAVSPSEVYLAVVTPALQVIWTTPGGFSLTPAPIYSGPLPSFASAPLINIPDAAVMPSGDYYWVAIVDTDANGVPNAHYVDFVKTTKAAAAIAIRRR